MSYISCTSIYKFL